MLTKPISADLVFGQRSGFHLRSVADAFAVPKAVRPEGCIDELFECYEHASRTWISRLGWLEYDIQIVDMVKM
jgi:hypothetical protein